MREEAALDALDDLLEAALLADDPGNFGIAIDTSKLLDAEEYELWIGKGRKRPKPVVHVLEPELLLGTFRAHQNPPVSGFDCRLAGVFDGGSRAEAVAMPDILVWETKGPTGFPGEYVLDEGTWWKCAQPWLDDLRSDFDHILRSTYSWNELSELPKYKKASCKDEDAYCELALGACKKNPCAIFHLEKFDNDGVKLELADFVIGGRFFVHLKRESDFENVSYVTNQARQAAAFLATHEPFRDWAHEKLYAKFGSGIDLGKPREYKFIAGVISGTKSLLKGRLSPRCMDAVRSFVRGVNSHNFEAGLVLIEIIP